MIVAAIEAPVGAPLVVFHPKDPQRRAGSQGRVEALRRDLRVAEFGPALPQHVVSVLDLASALASLLDVLDLAHHPEGGRRLAEDTQRGLILPDQHDQTPSPLAVGSDGREQLVVSTSLRHELRGGPGGRRAPAARRGPPAAEVLEGRRHPKQGAEVGIEVPAMHRPRRDGEEQHRGLWYEDRLRPGRGRRRRQRGLRARLGNHCAEPICG
mmetsp:Transcript_88764/g.286857  ORF Transcript_88764/g.286857 Transcript_88764/m.286857 type:complete len:211 (-) Transcript_88764:585-1217(-)